MGHGGVSQVTYTWGNLLDLVREAKRHKDFEMRSAILADICNAVDELDKDKEAMVDQAFECQDRNCPRWFPGTKHRHVSQRGIQQRRWPGSGGCQCLGLSHLETCPEWTLPI